jgi:biopolymer transport protein ExbB/TolQ
VNLDAAISFLTSLLDQLPLDQLPASFQQAGIVGRIVMAILGVASVWSWVLICEGAFSVYRLKRAVRRAARGRLPSLLVPIVKAGHAGSAVAIPGETVTETRLRVTEAMNRSAQDLLARADRGLPTLAVVASVSPFVGLFGTVWGIMASFASIAAAKDTSLAVVAPSIAEALAATAWGLAAAIPATVAYNRIGAALSRVSQKLSHFIDERAVAIMTERAPAAAKDNG